MPLANAKGRLTGVKIANATEPYPRLFSYAYDSRGSVILQGFGIMINGDPKIYITQYTYDLDGNLTSIRYPDGRTIAYNHQITDPDRIASVSTTVNGLNQTLASNISYYPFGDIKNLTFGNGIALTNQLDKRYFPQNITAAGVLNLSYTADSRGNITSITDNINTNPDRSQSFTYDLKDQLASASSPNTYGTFQWQYDPFGNRTTQTHNDETTNYFYRLTSNQLETDQLE